MSNCKSCGEKLEGGFLGIGGRCQNHKCPDYYVNNMGMNGVEGFHKTTANRKPKNKTIEKNAHEHIAEQKVESEKYCTDFSSKSDAERYIGQEKSLVRFLEKEICSELLLKTLTIENYRQMDGFGTDIFLKFSWMDKTKSKPILMKGVKHIVLADTNILGYVYQNGCSLAKGAQILMSFMVGEISKQMGLSNNKKM